MALTKVIGDGTGTRDNLTVADAGTIGSASKTDAITIASSGLVQLTSTGIGAGSQVFQVIDDGATLFQIRSEDGNVSFPQSGAGIYLGVTSGNSANLLNDYEEGTFTPTWSGYGTDKINSTSGRFVKVGNKVTVYAKLVTGTGNDASSVAISNLPFTISGDLGAGTLYHNTAGLRDMHIVTDFTANSTTCSLHGVLSGSDTTIKYVGTSPAIGGSSTLIWVLIYQTI